jgi:hypothetical protein
MISQGGLLVFGTFDPSGFKALPLDFSRVTGRCLHCERIALIDRSRTTEELLF